MFWTSTENFLFFLEILDQSKMNEKNWKIFFTKNIPTSTYWPAID